MTDTHEPQTSAAPTADSGADTAQASLVLTPPTAVTSVDPEQAAKEVPVDPAQAKLIDDKVSGYVAAVVALDVHDPSFSKRVGDVSSLGATEVQQYSAASNRLLDRPVKSLDSGFLTSGSKVGKGLIDLRHTVEDLNPEKHDLAHGGPRKLLGVIPFGDRIRAYFDKYEDAQTHINGIIASLKDGQDELVKDNASIEQEKVNLWSQIQRLREYAYMAERLDTALDAKITEVAKADPDKAKVLSSDVLFAVRQRRQDLLTQLAVDEQGYLALGLIKQNNTELIKGVDRATTTTVAALRTAVITAQALGNQKMVMEQVAAVNEVTGTMIEQTSEMLKQQSAQINEQAASATVDVQKLQTAFDNVFATLDTIDTFKQQALGSMKVTITELEGQVGRAQSYLERAQQERPAAEVGTGDGALALPGTGNGH